MANTVWTTKKVNETVRKIEQGLDADRSCFYQGDFNFRNGNINFEYTREEQEEIVKCASDILYFASRYCHAMTDEGVQQIKLRPYQRDMLKNFQDNRYIIMLASRQIGKCALYNTKICIYDTKKEGYFNMSLGNLYFMSLKQQRKLTLLEKIKWQLWKFYDKIN